MASKTNGCYRNEMTYDAEDESGGSYQSLGCESKLKVLSECCERENYINSGLKRQKVDEEQSNANIHDLNISDEVYSSYKHENLRYLLELASEESRAFTEDSDEVYEENEFAPPKSPTKCKDALEVLRDVARSESFKIKNKKPEEPKNIIRLLPSSQDGIYSVDSDLKSFNDFDETIFEFNEASKKYKCPNPECDKEFPSLSRIKRHFIIHTDIKPFKCENPECDKTFSRKDNMLQHSRVHCPFNNKRKEQ